MANTINLKLDGDNAWPDLADRGVIHLGNDTAIGIATLPDGMTSGRPSIAIRIDLPDGRVVVAETSWRLFAAAAKAIAARYGWPR